MNLFKRLLGAKNEVVREAKSLPVVKESLPTGESRGSYIPPRNALPPPPPPKASETEKGNRSLECPYCGYVFPSSWESWYQGADNSGVVDCDRCEREFAWSRDVVITYRGKKL